MENLLENNGVGVEEYLYALQQRNLVYNFDFKYFSNQVANGDVINYGIPDGWMYEDNGSNGTINFDDTTKQCVIKKSGGNEYMTFSQALHEFPRWKQMLLGQRVTCKVVMDTVIDGNVSVTLNDGVNSTSITKFNKGQLEFDLKLNIDDDANCLKLLIETKVPFFTMNISCCYVNVGNVAIKYLPCIVEGVIGERKQYIATETAPAEELSLCNGMAELTDDYTRLRSVINNKFGVNPKTNNPYLINMGGYFSRAWDNGSGVDPDANNRLALENGTITGDNVSTMEEDVFLKHNHGLDFSVSTTLKTGGDTTVSAVVSTTPSKTNDESLGKETRPINIAELYTIKWA